MTRTCVVPGCKSGYRSCKEKRSLFQMPSDPKRLEEWKRRIPRTDFNYTKSSVVCEKHFDESFIRRSYEHVINGEKIVIPIGKCVLTPGAVPTIFPNLSTGFKMRKQRKDIGVKKVGEKLAQKEQQCVDRAVNNDLLTPQPPTPVISPPILKLEKAKAKDVVQQCRNKAAMPNNLSTSARMVRMQEEIYRLRRKLKLANQKIENLRSGETEETNKKAFVDEMLVNLPNVQKIMLKECLQWANRNTRHEYKYSDEWILQCLLLQSQIKSDAYNFLRKNEILPLPSQTRLKSYLKSADGNCEFGDNFVSMLEDSSSDSADV